MHVPSAKELYRVHYSALGYSALYRALLRIDWEFSYTLSLSLSPSLSRISMSFALSVYLSISLSVSLSLSLFLFLSLSLSLHFLSLPPHARERALSLSPLSFSPLCLLFYVEKAFSVSSFSHTRDGGLGSRPKKMYGKRLGDGVEHHLMSPTPRC